MRNEISSSDKTCFIAISPAHISFCLSRLPRNPEDIRLLIIFEPKRYQQHSFISALENFGEITDIHILDYQKLVRDPVLSVINQKKSDGL